MTFKIDGDFRWNATSVLVVEAPLQNCLSFLPVRLCESCHGYGMIFIDVYAVKGITLRIALLKADTICRVVNIPRGAENPNGGCHGTGISFVTPAFRTGA